MKETCPICERGTLQALTMTENFSYGGKELSIENYEYSACLSCGEEIVLPDQAKRNEVRFSDAKRESENLLKSADIAAFRRRWSITQAQASRLFGGGVNAFSKYERGEVIQARSMDFLIRVSDRFSEVRDFLSDTAGIAFGDGWIPQTTLEGLVDAPLATQRKGCTVTDIVAYRTRLANDQAGNALDGQWISESFEDERRHG